MNGLTVLHVNEGQTLDFYQNLLKYRFQNMFLNLYDTPGLAPRMNVLYWGPGDFPVSYSNRNTSRNAWNRHSGSFMVDMGILFSNMKYPSHEC